MSKESKVELKRELLALAEEAVAATLQLQWVRLRGLLSDGVFALNSVSVELHR